MCSFLRSLSVKQEDRVQAQIHPCWEDEPDAEREAGCLPLSMEAMKGLISFLVLTTLAVNRVTISLSLVCYTLEPLTL